MAYAHQALPLAADSSDWLATYGWPLLLLFMLFVVFLYIWSYLNKNLERMKAIDSDYLDADVVMYLGRMAKAVMAIALLFLSAYVLSLIWPEFDDQVWQPYLGFFVELVIIVMVLVFSGLIVKMLRHFSRRSRLAGKGAKGMSGSVVEFTSLLLSYVVYIAAAVVVLVVLLTYVSPDVDVYQALDDFWKANGGFIGALVVFWVAVVLIVRVINALFEDFKYRTRKFNPQVIDLFKALVRFFFYLVALLITIFIIFTIMNLQTVGLVLVVIIVVFICLGLSLSYSWVKNIASGLALMNTEIFAIGDRIRIGEDLVCEVVEKNMVFTKVRTEDGETVDVPNSEILARNVLNYSRSIAHGITIGFKVHSSVPHAVVESMVLEAVTKVEGLTNDPAPGIFAKDFEGEMIAYEVRAYVLDALKAKRTRSDLIFRIRESFESGGRKMLSQVPVE